jgi:hypothetical protein
MEKERKINPRQFCGFLFFFLKLFAFFVFKVLKNTVMMSTSTVTDASNPGITAGGVNFQSPEMLALLQERLDSLAGILSLF